MAIVGTSAGRAAAVLTNGEVYGTVVDLQGAMDGKLSVDLTFTIDTLTSVTWRLAVGDTVPPTETLWINGMAMTGSLTASTEAKMTFDCAGYRYARFALTGVGAVGASSAAFDYDYNDYELGTKQDGLPRMG
jgi:hypothetical protein